MTHGSFKQQLPLALTDQLYLHENLSDVALDSQCDFI